MQISVKKHVKLAKYGCLRCGRFLFAPTWYRLYYNVMVCNCDASHFKASGVDVPDHIQAYWDAQFSVTSHSSYRRRLKRWTKRYLPSQLLYDQAFSASHDSHISDLHPNEVGSPLALYMLSRRKLSATLKSRFTNIHSHVRPERLFDNISHFAKVHRTVKDHFSDEESRLPVDNYLQARP